jgi:hypothetical protein
MRVERYRFRVCFIGVPLTLDYGLTRNISDRLTVQEL